MPYVNGKWVEETGAVSPTPKQTYTADPMRGMRGDSADKTAIPVNPQSYAGAAAVKSWAEKQGQAVPEWAGALTGSKAAGQLRAKEMLQTGGVGWAGEPEAESKVGAKQVATAIPGTGQQAAIDERFAKAGWGKDAYGNWKDPQQGGGQQSRSDKLFSEYDKWMGMEGGGSGVSKGLVAKMLFGRGKAMQALETEAGKEGERQKGQMAALERESSLRKQEKTEDPMAQAQLRLSALTEASAQQGLDKEKRKMALLAGMNDPDVERQAMAQKQYELEFGGRTDMQSRAKTFSDLVAGGMDEAEARKIAGFSSGGFVEGYADGGAIGRQQPSMESVHPSVAQYGQYLQAASSAGVPPVPFQQYLGLLQTTRGAMQQAPATYAEGGEVEDETEEGAIPVAGKLVSGPGTGTSDSIPAVINGKRPAALSDGEFVIPAHVVRAKGTEFFDKLLAQYEDKETGDGE